MSEKKDESRRRRRRSSSNPEHERSEGAYTVVLRNLSLVLAYRRMALASMLSVIAAVVSLVVLFLVAGKPVPPQYIPVTKDGRLIPLIPLNRPNADDGVIGEFALQAVSELNNYDYLNWQVQVPRAQRRFVPASWKTYLAEFEGTNIIRTVRDRKMIVVGRPAGSIEIQNQGLDPQGVYVWRVAVPITITYVAHAEGGAAGAASLASEGTVTLYIQRVPPTLSADGFAIRAYQYEETVR